MTRSIFAIIIFSLLLFPISLTKDDSPENALAEIKVALAERNSQKLSARADLEEFFSTTYDATTLELAKNYDVYKEKYADDLYFQYSDEFLTEYNAEHKDDHLKFLRGVAESYFAKVPEPSTPEDNPTAYVANEFEKIRQAASVTVKKVVVKDDCATVILDVAGDDSLRGRLIGQMTFKLGFRKEKERWQFEAIENLDELTPALVDKAEIVWINL